MEEPTFYSEAQHFAQLYRDEEALRLHAEEQVRALTDALKLFLDPTVPLAECPEWLLDARSRARKLLYPTSVEGEQPWR